MKKTTAFFMSTLLALMAFGCSSSDSTSQSSSKTSSKPAPANATCSLSSDGLSMTFELTAPTKSDDVETMVVKLIVPFELGREMVGIDSSQASDEEMKKVLAEMEDTYKSLFASRFDIPQEDITLEALDDAAVFNITVKDVKAFTEKTNFQTEDPDSVTFDEMVKTLKDNDFVCE